MPPKTKASSKAPNPEPRAAPESPPDTIAQRSQQRFFQTNPIENRRQQVGLSALTPAEKKIYAHVNLIHPAVNRRVPFSNKTEREFWKFVTKEGLPIRRLPRDYAWGKDRSGRDIGTYSPDELEQRTLKHAKLTSLQIQHRQFLKKREKQLEVTTEEIAAEKTRRKAMAALKRDLYGEITGSLAQDPEWDDVIPIPQNEPEGALAQIAYPDDYAEAVSYLRAVMAADECSPRSLRLTEHVIAMNPAHYTVWLFRFKIISVLKLSIPDEITWLNEVALSNLKNYQIWNHRQLLMDYYYPLIEEDTATVRQLARSETQFITKMLESDAKNYHVWSYRQYLVSKLYMWTMSELLSTQNHIEEDVRNNSAWSHRFYLVFSDPTASTPGSGSTEPDPRIPAETIDREINYSKEKIDLAPQNQSPWNYVFAVLAKGSRPLSSFKEFAEKFVTALGEEAEEVRSSHALDFLAKLYDEEGDKEKAELCLRRLGEKWDPVREGYWKYRVTLLKSGQSATE
ncbi:related to geranylgeranyltransferase type I alpha subunit (RAM2) [Fusarium fujikuroi]|uniref:Protein farnesyltransferase/geranylgeranyltransferase type-1 subunit alpha n=1 Tax=Fusarium fujikuroi TaxID=5127 RepID=A0A5Q3D865_FUSFU|nr:geranylgeranyltransferase type I alpha subunit (RAM2) [Fusarium fujikuroi]QGI62945.1 hypothetical protein CEK27_006916 [Fusarium fujikuroi]QGI93831.1 hypothetical protein CEK26_006900 [Fusarium fujikuroi]SCN80727.1 related to geranylgeranyltransferase type I alpha subunit (RAM2) [Fusarium fujikuroi]SCO22340.1 related to geranylgeranyltransferase type I alpha subunit (RAM2) [Fusarium fujikuroi]